MKIVIFGAGAIGSYFGASLILSGNEVVFLERESTADSLLKTGISLYRKEIVQKVSGLRVCTSISSALKEGPFDFGILAVKSYDTLTFLHSIQRRQALFHRSSACKMALRMRACWHRFSAAKG